MKYFLSCANFKDSFQVVLFLGLASFLAFMCWLLGWSWWFKVGDSRAVSNPQSLYIALSFLMFCSVNSSMHSQIFLLKLLRLLGTAWLFIVYLYYSLETPLGDHRALLCFPILGNMVVLPDVKQKNIILYIVAWF